MLGYLNLIQYGLENRIETYCQRKITGLKLVEKLSYHSGCVNALNWSTDGRYLASGSDDLKIIIYDFYQNLMTSKVTTSHTSNIFCVKFFPHTHDKIVSSAGNETVIVSTINCQSVKENLFKCHYGPVFKVVPLDRDTFLSAGEDGTVRFYDLKTKHSCNRSFCQDNIAINCGQPVTCMVVNDSAPYQVICGCLDGSVRLYDRRKIKDSVFSSSLSGMFGFYMPELANDEDKINNGTGDNYYGHHNNRITSLAYDSSRQDVLVSYSEDAIHLFNLDEAITDDLEDEPSIANELEDGQKANSRINTHNDKKSHSINNNTKHFSFHPSQIRLRGDWSDTGPSCYPLSDDSSVSSSQSSTTIIPTEHVKDKPQTDNCTQNISDELPSISQQNTSINMMCNNTDNFYLQNRTEESSNNNTLPEHQALNISPNINTNTESNDQPNNPSHSNSTNARNPRQNRLTRILMGQMTEMLTRLVEARQLATSRNNQGDSNQSSVQSSGGNRILLFDSADPPYLSHENDTDTFNNNHGNRNSHQSTSSEDENEQSHVTNTDPMILGKKPNLKTLLASKQIIRSSTCVRYKTLKVYKGHRNTRTMIKECNFWGDGYILSGSDCGHIFIWDRETQKILNIIEADKHVVNCVQPNLCHLFLASSGIDYDVKLWAPCCDSVETTKDKEKRIASQLNRNRKMLIETRDIVTIPASFMIRMLASMRRNVERLENATTNTINQHDDDDENSTNTNIGNDN